MNLFKHYHSCAYHFYVGSPEVCYGEVGCFPLRSYCGEDIFLPQPPEHIDTTFLLYTSNQTGQAITYHMSGAQFSNRGFDSSLDTKIVIHGFVYSANGAGITDIRDGFLAQVYERLLNFEFNLSQSMCE